MYESPDAFANVLAVSTPPGIPGRTRLFWANGVLFRFFPLLPSEVMAREIVNGHLIWDHIEFAPMPEYRNLLQVAERPLLTINVLNVSNHIVFRPVTEWIRDNLIGKKLSKQRGIN